MKRFVLRLPFRRPPEYAAKSVTKIENGTTYRMDSRLRLRSRGTFRRTRLRNQGRRRSDQWLPEDLHSV